jgi:hypothetical protein
VWHRHCKHVHIHDRRHRRTRVRVDIIGVHVRTGRYCPSARRSAAPS